MSVASQNLSTTRVRAFEPEDSAAVEFVVLSSLQEWGSLPSARDQQELEAMQSQNPFETFLVAEDPIIGVVGCVGFVKLTDETCEIRKLYLLKRFRGKAIGQQLLNACVQEAKKRHYKRMRIEVNSGMAGYAPFYFRNGFMLNVTEKPIHNPSADYVFYKELT